MSHLPEELRERFRPRELLGEGGMGRVIRAYEVALDRDVAIKLALRPDPGLLERLRREARTLSEIRNPHVVEVYDFGVAGDQAYLVMEYLDGLPLDEVPLEEVVPAILQVADALEVLHERGVLHRDLKPQNVLVTRAGRAVLLDFGLVKGPEVTAMTATGALVGTLPFLPPEVHQGAVPGPEADWYALGVTLYWLHEGGAPYRTEELITWAKDGAAPPLRFSRIPEEGAVARMVRACLAPCPRDRPRCRRDLEALQAGEAEPAPRSPSRGTPGPLRRQPWWTLAPGLLALCIGVGVVRPWEDAAPTPPSPPSRTDEAPAPPLPPEMRELGRNAAGRRQARNLVDGSVMILLPAATIQARGVVTFDSLPVEPGPPREVRVPALWIDRHEVTVERYQHFLAAVGFRLPEAWEVQLEEPQHPVCFVGVEEAMAYARWAGGRLPSPEEWERAAAGPEGRTYPWGEAAPTSAHAHLGHPEITVVTRGPRALRAVGSFPLGASPDGVLDLVGSVAEWAAPGPEPGPRDRAILLGGSLLRNPAAIHSWNLRSWPRIQDGMGTGFRVVRDHVGDS